MFFILTNSGVTAEETLSSGLGGVWFTGTTDFDAAAKSGDAVTGAALEAEYEPYTQDAARYAIVMGTAPGIPRFNWVKCILNPADSRFLRCA
jgi:hypothetical protein